MTPPRLLIFAGLALVLLGAVWFLLERLGVRPGRLPGDIVLHRGQSAIYIPIVTCLLLSLLLSLAAWAIRSWRR